MQAGDLGAMSVIPGKATLVGTVRTFSSDGAGHGRAAPARAVQRRGAGLRRHGHACNYERIYPATINTADEARVRRRRGASRWSGADNVVRDMEPSMGAEDFSFMLQVKPGAYLRIGQGARRVAAASCTTAATTSTTRSCRWAAALHAGLVEQAHAAAPAGGIVRPLDPVHFQPEESAMNFKIKAARGRRVRALLALPAWCAGAQTLRIANQGDALSMDPHSLNESLQLSVDGNVYEPLVGRDKDLSLAPALATSWKQTSPTVWRFELRKGVQFHDGTPFTADDVIFSFAARRGRRLRHEEQRRPTSRKCARSTTTRSTSRPRRRSRSCPTCSSLVYIMSKKWCETNQATKPVDRRKGIENAASFRANGTGPYRVRERQPNVRTVFVRNGNYWGKIEGNVQRGDLHADRQRRHARGRAAVGRGRRDGAGAGAGHRRASRPAPNCKVLQGPELRTIFLGMDQKRDELLYSSVKGKNPFKDKRVRQAFYQAIDIEGIKTHRDARRRRARPR